MFKDGQWPKFARPRAKRFPFIGLLREIESYRFSVTTIPMQTTSDLLDSQILGAHYEQPLSARSRAEYSDSDSGSDSILTEVLDFSIPEEANEEILRKRRSKHRGTKRRLESSSSRSHSSRKRKKHKHKRASHRTSSQLKKIAWCFTINNPEVTRGELEEKLQSIAKYYVFQLECGDSETTDHFQGYVYLKGRHRLSWMQSHLNSRAHFEAANGTPEQNTMYCSKSQTKKEGPWIWGTYHACNFTFYTGYYPRCGFFYVPRPWIHVRPFSVNYSRLNRLRLLK